MIALLSANCDINSPHRAPRNRRLQSLREQMTGPKIFKFIGISGSLRKESFNTKLLKAFAAAAKEDEFVSQGIEFEIIDWSK
jgi:NADPH-dependent FMN reductase